MYQAISHSQLQAWVSPIQVMLQLLQKLRRHHKDIFFRMQKCTHRRQGQLMLEPTQSSTLHLLGMMMSQVFILLARVYLRQSKRDMSSNWLKKISKSMKAFAADLDGPEAYFRKAGPTAQGICPEPWSWFLNPDVSRRDGVYP